MSIGSLYMRHPSPGRFPCPSRLDPSVDVLCSEEEFCKNPRYTKESDFGPLTRDYDLVCERSIMSIVMMASFFLGGSMGALYYGEQ